MQITKTVKLYLTDEQRAIIVSMMNEYISVLNRLVALHISGTSIAKYTTKTVKSNLPSNSENACIYFAKAVVKKYEKDLWKCNKRKEKGYTNVKEPIVPVFKRPFCGVTNQVFEIVDEGIKFPICENGKVRRIVVKTGLSESEKEALRNAKRGEMKFVYQGRKIVATIPYEVAEAETREDGNVMGVDLGIKCPAVSYISDGNSRFYGNGFHNKFVRREFYEARKHLMKKKHLKVVKSRGNKEQRIMKDIDHYISHEIVNEAIAHNVSVIKLELLKNIRNRMIDAKKRMRKNSRKNNRYLHSWSFYRLMQHIEYKAKIAGIKVVYVNPAYTSQTCPKCGRINKADDRNYVCPCGYHVHRDLLGAINICNSTEIVTKGKRERFVKKTENTDKNEERQVERIAEE